MAQKDHATDRAIGARVRFARIEKRLSQGALGEALGISFQQVQKYELGKDRISASQLLNIARTVKKDVAFFYEGVDSAGELDAPLANIMDRRGRAPGATRRDIDTLLMLQRLPGDVKRRLCSLLEAIADPVPATSAPAPHQQAAE